MDWSRKHLADLSGLCRDCEQDPALSVSQREAFARARQLAKQCSTLPTGGGARSVTAAITQTCGACQEAFQPTCAGRSDWQYPCPLLQSSIYRLTG